MGSNAHSAITPTKTSAPPDGIAYITADAIHVQMGMWHKLLNVTSGDMALHYGGKPVPKPMIETWVKRLQGMLDEMKTHTVMGD